MDWERGKKDIAITSILPACSIDSAAAGYIKGTDPEAFKELRTIIIYPDAFLAMLEAPIKRFNRMLELNGDSLKSYQGVADFSKRLVTSKAVS